MLESGKSYSREQVRNEVKINTDRADVLLKKLKAMGYTAIGNGRKGDNYRIIIKDVPEEVDKIEKFKKYGCKFEPEKIAQLLYSLGTNYNVSFHQLERVNYYSSDDTIQKYLTALEKIGVVKLNPKTQYYATKKRELYDYELTIEEYENDDYKYIMQVREISEEQYDEAMRAGQQYYEEHKNDLICKDELEYFTNKAKCEVIQGWFPQRNYYGFYELNANYKQIDYYVSLLDKAEKEYLKIYTGNHTKEQEQWNKRTEKWDEERERLQLESEKKKKLEEAEKAHKENINILIEGDFTIYDY